MLFREPVFICGLYQLTNLLTHPKDRTSRCRDLFTKTYVLVLEVFACERNLRLTHWGFTQYI